MFRSLIVAMGVVLASGNAWAGACNNSNFLAFYNGVAHPENGNPNYVHYDASPDNYNPFSVHCYASGTNSSCFDYYGSRYKVVLTSAPTKKWSAAVCGRADQADFWYNHDHNIYLTNGTSFYGAPRVMFQYQKDNGSWDILRSSSSGQVGLFEFGPDQTQAYRWKWTTSKARRFRVVVDRAMLFDQFDMIMDW